MLRARAGLGVTSFGMQILRLPPNTDRYPEHDHSASGQEEVFTVLDGAVTLGAGDEEYRLEPGAFARVGPNENRKLLTGDEGRRCLRSAECRAPLRAGHLHERGRAGPARWLTSRSSGSASSRPSSVAASTASVPASV